MKTTIKKTVSTILVFGLVTSQIACAGKTAYTTLDKAQFDSNYLYSVKLKTKQTMLNIPGDQIHHEQDQVIIKSGTETKTIQTSEIQTIRGITKNRTGSQIIPGLGIGAAIGAVPGVLVGLIVGIVTDEDFDSGFCENEPCTTHSGTVADGMLVGGLVGLLIGAGGGGLIGAGIGAAIPKHDKVQITPIFTPTTSGVNTGINVGFKF